MRILVVSDSHGNSVLLQKIIDAALPFSHIIHCGDGVGDIELCRVPDGTEVTSVAGNVDAYIFPDMKREDTVEFQGQMYLVTHGDRYNVKNGYTDLRDICTAKNYAGAFFGHTHIKHYSTDGCILFNPGPAMMGCYGIIEIDAMSVCRHYYIE